MPARDFKDEEEFLAYFQSQSKLIIDITEFRAERPCEDKKQKEVYRGKKNHMGSNLPLKELVITGHKKKILYN